MKMENRALKNNGIDQDPVVDFVFHTLLISPYAVAFFPMSVFL